MTRYRVEYLVAGMARSIEVDAGSSFQARQMVKRDAGFIGATIVDIRPIGKARGGPRIIEGDDE